MGDSSIKTTTIYTHLTKSAVDKIKSPLDIMVDENNMKKTGVENVKYEKSFINLCVFSSWAAYDKNRANIYIFNFDYKFVCSRM
jgi:hypothetical protein